MRFIMMHKHDSHTEAGELPPPELVAQMGAFIDEHARAGRFVDGAGLGASKTRTRLSFKDGRCSIQPGPYTGERELPANLLVLQVKTREEAIGWAERYGKILSDGELELGKVTEPWDLGLMPEPEGAPLQFLLVDKATAETEGTGRSTQVKAALTRLQTEMTKAGVLQRRYALEPSRRGKRLHFTNNKLRIVDGPFTESKEMIGGFAVMNLASIEEAIELDKRYAEILGGTLEIDVRGISDE
jgi:hypothetical protein